MDNPPAEIKENQPKLPVAEKGASEDLPSYDFIAGFLTAVGSFMWVKQKSSEVPVFQLKTRLDDSGLIELIKSKLGIKETLHIYNHQNRQYSLLLIRSRKTIETILIPILDGRLFGPKKIQFDLWKKKYFEKKLDFLYKRHS